MTRRHEIPPTEIDAVFREMRIRTTDVALSLGVNDSTVRSWRLGRTKIKPSLAKLVNLRFGVPLHRMRPDCWDDPAEQSSPRKAA